MQCATIRFATPPRRYASTAQPADAELSVLTAGASLAHEEARPEQPAPGSVGNVLKALTSTPSDPPQRCKSNGSLAALGVWSANISPKRQRPQHRRSGGGVSGGLYGAAGDLDSPCGSPRLRLTGALSGRGTLARTQLCGGGGSFCHVASAVRRGANACGNSNSSAATTASGNSAVAVTGVSPFLSATPSETEDDGAATGGESVLASSTVEPLAGLRSVAPGIGGDARPPSSPSFAYFSGSSHGGRRGGSPFARDRSLAGSVNLAFSPLFGARSVRDAGAGSINSNSSTEHKFFEPLRFDTLGRPFSPPPPPPRRSWPLTSQRTSCVPAPEPCALDSAAASAKDKDLDAAQAPLSTSHGSPGEVVKQQQLLHACLISIARERTEAPNSLRGYGSRCSSPTAMTPKSGHQGSRRLAVLYLLLTVLLRLPLRILAKALSAACWRVTRVLA